MTTARRVFLYLIALVGLVLLAIGGGLLLGLVFDLLLKGAGIGRGGFISQQFSLSIAMLLIGGGLWFPFWNIIQKRAAAAPEETGASFRKLYLNFIQTVSALTALSAGIDSLNWLFGSLSSFDFPSSRFAALIVASLVWYFHWRISESEGHPTPAARTMRRWYVYILSAWGLITLVFNIVQFLNSVLSLLPVWQPAIVYGNAWQAIYPNLSAGLLAALAWWFFWFRMARHDAGSTLRQVYFYLLAISVSAIAGLVALTTAIFRILAYILGAQGSPSYFQFLTWTIPTILVAAAVWFYHQRLAQEEAAGSPQQHLSARRVHLYLMSFISLGAMVAGVTVLLGLVLDFIITALGGDVIAGTPYWWREQVKRRPWRCYSLAYPSGSITGAGFYRWWVSDAAERRARSRRIFLYIVLGLAIIGLAAGLVNLVYRILNVLFAGSSPEFIRDIKWGLQAILVAAPLLLYFLQVIRQDQRAGAEAIPAAKHVTVIANADTTGILEGLAERLGYRVTDLRYTGPAGPPVNLSPAQLDDAADRIREAAGPKVMLVIINNVINVLPYQD